MKIMTMLTACLVLVSGAFADYTTGFNTGEGFVDDTSLLNIAGWTGSGTYNSRYKSINGTGTETGPVPFEGDMYARVWNAGEGTRAFTALGSVGVPYEVTASISMAASDTATGYAFTYIHGDVIGEDAAVFGFNTTTKTFAYYNGVSIYTIGSYSADTWYTCDVTLYGNGSGGGTYSLTISGGDLTADIVLTGKNYRHTGIDTIASIGIYAGTGINGVYFDDISVALVPGFSTGFNTGEGFTDGATFIGVHGWASSAYVSRSYTQSGDTNPGPAPFEGDLYARIWNTAEATHAFAPFGIMGETYEVEASLMMAVSSANTGQVLAYIHGDNIAEDAAVFGFGGGTGAFTYYNGGYNNIGSFTANVWYKFDVVVYGNGSGGGTYDLTISGGDLGSAIKLSGLAYRNTGIDTISSIGIYSASTYPTVDGCFDDISVSTYVAPPPPPSGTLIIVE